MMFPLGAIKGASANQMSAVRPIAGAWGAGRPEMRPVSARAGQTGCRRALA